MWVLTGCTRQFITGWLGAYAKPTLTRMLTLPQFITERLGVAGLTVLEKKMDQVHPTCEG